MEATYKVLMIAPTPFFADRGCHVRIYEEIRALQAQGCDVVLCTYHIGREMPGVRTERIVGIPWYKKLEAGPSWQKPFLDILLIFKSISIARRFRPHIIHAHLHEGAFVGFLTSRLLKLPLVFDYQGSMTEEMVDHRFVRRGGLLFRIFRIIERWIDRKADVIVLSATAGGGLLTSEFGIPSERIISVTDGVDTDIFKPLYPVEDLKGRFIIPANRKVVVYLGVLNEYQGIDILLHAAVDVISERPDTHFLIMGYPEKKYRDMAGRLGIGEHVTFTGRIDYKVAPTCLCLGDIAVSPKLSGTEANGKVYNYMAAGLPTVCFDTPVNREILGETGIYADLADKNSLASKLIEALSDDFDLSSLRVMVREKAVKEYSWEKKGELLKKIYECKIENTLTS